MHITIWAIVAYSSLSWIIPPFPEHPESLSEFLPSWNLLSKHVFTTDLNSPFRLYAYLTFQVSAGIKASGKREQDERSKKLIDSLKQLWSEEHGDLFCIQSKMFLS